MSDVFFKPWIGSQYEEGIHGRKVMVLGHNHYCSDRPQCLQCTEPSCRLFTMNVISGYLKSPFSAPGEGRWVTTFNILKGRCWVISPMKEKGEHCGIIFFYNYVQEAMSDPNAKPTAKQYADAQDPFRQTLQEYLPDVIIAWGNGAYDHTPNDGGVMIHPVEYDGAKAPGWRYLQYGKPIDLFKIHHPSR